MWRAAVRAGGTLLARAAPAAPPAARTAATWHAARSGTQLLRLARAHPAMVPVRHASGGMLRVMVTRLIMVPGAVLIGGGAAFEGMRKQMPQIPDLGISDAWERALSTMRDLKEKSQERLHQLTAAQEKTGEEEPKTVVAKTAGLCTREQRRGEGQRRTRGRKRTGR